MLKYNDHFTFDQNIKDLASALAGKVRNLEDERNRIETGPNHPELKANEIATVDAKLEPLRIHALAAEEGVLFHDPRDMGGLDRDRQTWVARGARKGAAGQPDQLWAEPARQRSRTTQGRTRPQRLVQSRFSDDVHEVGHGRGRTLSLSGCISRTRRRAHRPIRSAASTLSGRPLRATSLPPFLPDLAQASGAGEDTAASLSPTTDILSGVRRSGSLCSAGTCPVQPMRWPAAEGRQRGRLLNDVPAIFYIIIGE